MALTLSGSTDTGYGVAGDTNGVRVNNNGTTVATFGTTGKSLALEGASAQSGTGITFPATQVASSNANTLDDYEEGTWTPTDASGASLSFTVASAVYIKMGRLVIAQCDITYPSTASGSNARVGGLPFSTNTAGGGFCMYCTGSFGITARNVASDPSFLLTNITSPSTAILNSDLSTRPLQMSFVYQVA